MSQSAVAKVSNQLEIIDRLSSGRNGRVFRAKLNETICAVKYKTRIAYSDEKKATIDIRREAATMALFDHPGIPVVYSCGQEADENFIVMEYIEGHTLADLIRAKKLTVNEIAILSVSLASAIDELHSKGFVHRDIKPENIIVRDNGLPVLIDFGLCIEVSQIQKYTSVGTAVYASPEQLGSLETIVDQRSDFYSLGVVLYEMLSGQPPFQSSDLSTLAKMHALDQVPKFAAPQSSVEEKLQQLTLVLLAKDPQDRLLNLSYLIKDVLPMLAIDQRKRLESYLALKSKVAVIDSIRAYLKNSRHKIVLNENVESIIKSISRDRVEIQAELILFFVRSGLLYPHHGHWTLDEVSLAQQSLTVNIFHHLQSNLDKLADDIKNAFCWLCHIRIKLKHSLIEDLDKVKKINLVNSLKTLQEQGLIIKSESDTWLILDHENWVNYFSQKINTEVLNDEIAETISCLKNRDDSVEIALAIHKLSGQMKDPNQVFKYVKQAYKIAYNKAEYKLSFEMIDNFKSKIENSTHFTDLADVYELYAKACLLTKRIDNAHQFFEKALATADTKMKRARILLEHAKVHIENFELTEAIEKGEIGVKELSGVIATGSLASWAMTIIRFISTPLFKLFKNQNHERTDILFKINEQLQRAYYFDNGMISATQAALLNYHYSSRSRDKLNIFFSKGLSAVLSGTLGFTKLTTKKLKALKNTINQDTMSVEYADYLFFKIAAYGVAGQDYKIEKDYPLWLEKYLDWMDLYKTTSTAGIQMTGAQVRGNVSVGISCIESWLLRMKTIETEPEMLNHFTFWCYHIGSVLYAMSGDITKCLEYRKKIEGLKIHCNYDQALFYNNELQLMLEMGEFDARADDLIAKFNEFKIPRWAAVFYICRIYYLEGYLHLYRAELELDANKKESHLKKLKQSISNCFWQRKFHVWRPHLLILEAGLCRLRGQNTKADKKLKKALDLSSKYNSPLTTVEAYRQMALLYRYEQRSHESEYASHMAHSVARQYGLLTRAKNLAKEFDIISTLPGYFDSTSKSSHLTVTSNESTHFESHGNKIMNSLLEINMASTASTNPKEQIRAVLDETVNVLKAERVFLFLFDQDSRKSISSVGRDSNKQDLIQHEGYSATVVDKVKQSGLPFVVSGTNSQLVADSQSILLNDLRSIIAAPVMMKNNMIGVIYLDSRFARGIFTQKDVQVLSALSSHIAIALERAEAMEMALNSQLMEKDLEVAAAVQRLIFPQMKDGVHKDCDYSVYYQSSAKTGGDWWWHEKADDRHAFISSDVTGHGAGPAMVTAIVAATYKCLKKFINSEVLESTFLKLNEVVTDICRGHFWMSMTFVEWNAHLRNLTWSTAAAPGFLLHVKGREKTELIYDTSSAFGMDEFAIKFNQLKIEEKARVLIFTDGAYEELCKSGRQLGLQKLVRIFDSTLELPVKEALEKMVQDLRSEYAASVPSDDISLILIDLK